MSPHTRRTILKVAALLAPGIALALFVLGGAGLLLAPLDAAGRDRIVAAVAPALDSHGVILLAWWLAAAALGAYGVQRLVTDYVAAPGRLAEATQALVSDAAAPDVAAEGARPVRAVATAVNALAAQRRGMQQDMARLVEDASRNVAQQRDQLATLMAQLQQSVVVCNRDGRILLYNARALGLVRRLTRTARGSAGTELMGLGRSIHGVVDRALIAHAREMVALRLGRGESEGVSARFVTTTPSGHLLRVLLAPVGADAGTAGGAGGFVLLLDDITDEYDVQARRDLALAGLTEASRASLASMQAALDMLDYPDLVQEERDAFQTVVRDEVAAMGGRLAALVADASNDLKTRWPLQDMLGTDLAAAIVHRLAEETGTAPGIDGVAADLWLSVDSFALIEAVAALARRLADPPRALELRLSRAAGRAHLDLAFTGALPAADALAAWQADPMRSGESASPLSVRDVAERHDGAVWFERTADGSGGCFRFLLLLAGASAGLAAPALVPGAARPEYYDFDLFAAGAAARSQDDVSLGSLAYTVFDTETTGLDPGGGDEIIQIGATRIVNGRLLRGECFDELVDPGRSIPEAGIAIHHITPQMVRGRPPIGEVLPAFHAFAADTVLVGHNVAFDMRFLKLKEASCKVVFDQPVLDTLLLASIVHPNAGQHALEAIAARLGVSVSARHNALGDALVTAEVFLRLGPLLRQRGIETLGDARAAAEESYYARLRY